jgi:hypothetical protein
MIKSVGLAKLVPTLFLILMVHILSFYYIRSMKGGEIMAIETITEKKSLKLAFEAGEVDGKQKVSYKTLGNVKLDATDENIHISGQALTGLQEFPLIQMKKIEESVIQDV